MASTKIQQYLGGVAAVTCVGTTRSGSPSLAGGLNVLTTSAGQVAATLPSSVADGAPVIVFCSSATTATVFPPATGGTIQGGSADAAFSVAQNKTAVFYPTGSSNWVAVLSA